MNLLVLFLAVIGYVAALVAGAVVPSQPRLSRFELDRRKQAGDTQAASVLRRLELLPIIRGALLTKSILLLVATSWLWVASLGWGWGAAISVISILLYRAIVTHMVVRRMVNRLYHKHEPQILAKVRRYRRWLKIFASKESSVATSAIASREELMHLAKASGLLTSAEQKRMTSNMSYQSVRVLDYMIPRAAVDAIAADEILGPLVLDDLHKTGHTIFPVVQDTVPIGLVDLGRLTNLRIQESPAAHQAMSVPLGYVRDDYTLDQALGAFLRTKQPILIVIDRESAWVGIVSIADSVRMALGTYTQDAFTDDTLPGAVLNRTMH